MVYWREEGFIVQFLNYISWDLIAQKVTFSGGEWEHNVYSIGKLKALLSLLFCYLCLYFFYLLGMGLSPL